MIALQPEPNIINYMTSNITTITAAIAGITALAALAISSCQKAPLPVPEKDPVITPTSATQINSEASGGKYDIAFKVENPLKDGSVTIATTPEWISCSGSKDKISVTVLANGTAQPREASFAISYGNKSKSASFTINIRQSAKVDKPEEPEDNPASISITIKETGYDFVKAEAFPSTDTLHCIALVTEKQYIDTFASDKEFFASEIQYFTKLSKETGFTISEVISKLGGKGLRDVKVDRLKKGTDYSCYSYFITVSDTPELLSRIFREDFRTLEPETGQCTFDIKVEPSATEARITVTPQDNDQLYYFYAESVENVELSEGEDFKAKLGAYIEEMLHFFTMTGRPLTDILSKGPDTDVAYDLGPDKKHVAFATGVNEQGMITTEITYVEFSTLPAGR